MCTGISSVQLIAIRTVATSYQGQDVRLLSLRQTFVHTCALRGPRNQLRAVGGSSLTGLSRLLKVTF